MIESVIVGTVSLRVTGRCQDRHLVPIYRVTSIKVFHLVRHLRRNSNLGYVIDEDHTDSYGNLWFRGEKSTNAMYNFLYLSLRIVVMFELNFVGKKPPLTH